MSRPKKIVFIVVCVLMSAVLLICPVMAESASQFDYSNHVLKCKSILYPSSSYKNLYVGSAVDDIYDGNNNAVYNYDIRSVDSPESFFGGEPSEKLIINLSFDSISKIDYVEIKNFTSYDSDLMDNAEYNGYVYGAANEEKPPISVSLKCTEQNDGTFVSTNNVEIVVDLSNLQYSRFTGFRFELWIFVPDTLDSWIYMDDSLHYVTLHNSFACRTITESEYKSDPEYQMNLEKTEATNSGNASVDSITNAIPDLSSGFLNSFSNLASAMSTKTTTSKWYIPKIKLPAIPGVMSEIPLTSIRLEIDFEYWVNQIPSNALSVVRIICTCALLIFCVKELYGLIQSVMVNKGGDD